MTKEEELQKIKDFIGEDEWLLEEADCEGYYDSWCDSLEEALYKIKEPYSDCRIVKVFDIDDLK